MVPTEDRRRVFVLSLLVLMAGCGPDERWEVPGLPGDSLATSLEDSTVVEAVQGQNLARQQEAHRAMVVVDSLFPHSEHRTLECQRCHQRPQGHLTHREIECRSCHGRPAQFATLPERTPRECAACHHRNVDNRSCRSCHTSDEVGSRPVLVAVQAAGADEPRVRTLTFDHQDHRSRECRTCHTAPATLAFGRDCASCHEYHHQQDARCMTCHVEVETPVHSGDVHAGCAGGGCHGDAPVLSLEPQRNICQVCHQDLVDHRPGQECTMCHVGFGESLGERAGGGR